MERLTKWGESISETGRGNDWRMNAKMLDRYVEIPRGLNLQMLRDKFGYDAVEFYTNRIKQRELEGKTYYNPLKTVYIWATEDRAKGQGFYSSYRGYSRGRKHKNYGGS